MLNNINWYNLVPHVVSDGGVCEPPEDEVHHVVHQVVLHSGQEPCRILNKYKFRKIFRILKY